MVITIRATRNYTMQLGPCNFRRFHPGGIYVVPQPVADCLLAAGAAEVLPNAGPGPRLTRPEPAALEYRSVATAPQTRLLVPAELRAEASATTAEVSGYGSVFGTVDSYGDTIERGAFAKSLQEWKSRGKLPKMLLQHGGGIFGGAADDGIPIGAWLEMREDDHGLFVRGRLFDVDTDRQRQVIAAVRSGEMDGLSIGFRVRKADPQPNGQDGRIIREAELFEVSIVVWPANDPARITFVRSALAPSRLVQQLAAIDAGCERIERQWAAMRDLRGRAEAVAAGVEARVEQLGQRQAEQHISPAAMMWILENCSFGG